MGDIVQFNGATSLDIEPEKVLEGGKNAGLDTVLVIGWRDKEFYIASSTGDIGAILLMLKIAERETMAGVE